MHRGALKGGRCCEQLAPGPSADPLGDPVAPASELPHPFKGLRLPLLSRRGPCHLFLAQEGS